MLKQLVTAKTGYISDKLYNEALWQAETRKSEYDSMCEPERTEYKANMMAVYIINKDLKGD